MSKKVETSLATLAATSYPTASNTNSEHARNFMLRNIVDNAHWPMNTKFNDANTKLTRAQAIVDETVANESTSSGKVIMTAGSKAIGAPHYSEDDANKLIDWAERDEYEAQCHDNFVKGLIEMYETITGDKYIPKAQRSGKKDVNAAAKRLAARTAAE